MIYKIQYTKKTETQLFEIYTSHAQADTYTAAQLLMKIKGSIDLLEEFPYCGVKFDEKFRCIVDRVEQYQIVYKIGFENIYIVSIFKYENSKM